MTSFFSRFKRRLKSQGHGPEELDLRKAPRHVAIIMDGNGRWAQRRGLPRLAGHRAGARAIREVVEIAPTLGIEYLTLYTFSSENWRRPKDEVSGLMKLFREMLEAEIGQLHENNIRLLTIGDTGSIGEETRAEFAKAVELTKDNTGLTLVIALNYSGRADILSASKKIAAGAVEAKTRAEDLDEPAFAAALSTAGIPEPGLIVRTSGEMRLSNFLIWESAYSEFWVTDVLWPDFGRQELIDAIYDYQQRDRRFGGL